MAPSISFFSRIRRPTPWRLSDASSSSLFNEIAHHLSNKAALCTLNCCKFYYFVRFVKYFRYGNEDKLAGLCGVIQALVSVVEEQNQDILRSITTKDCKAVFLVKGPLILVAVSKSNENETQLVLQLT